MPERFTYPPDMAAEIPRQRARRRWFWVIFLALPWVIALWPVFQGHGWSDLPYALGFSVMALFLEYLLRRLEQRTLQFVGQTLEHDSPWLRQFSREGTLVDEIDLSAPFTVRIPYHAVGNALYTVRQTTRGETNSLIFSSRIENAERLVIAVLHQTEWPPGANSG